MVKDGDNRGFNRKSVIEDALKRQDAMTNQTPDLRSEIQEKGFGFVRNALPRALREQLIGMMSGAFPGQGNARHITAKAPILPLMAPCLLTLLTSISPEPLLLVRSIFFNKTPGVNWSVEWHQDLTIAVTERRELEGFSPWSMKEGVWHVQPPVSVLERMMTLRLHLDPCTPSNGPLRVVPGSHLAGKISPDSLRGGIGTRETEACLCAEGDVLVMKPLLLHASSRSLGTSIDGSCTWSSALIWLSVASLTPKSRIGSEPFHRSIPNDATHFHNQRPSDIYDWPLDTQRRGISRLVASASG